LYNSYYISTVALFVDMPGAIDEVWPAD